MNKKHKITTEICEVYLDGSIESAIAELESLKEKYSPSYSCLTIDVTTVQSKYEGDSYTRILLSGTREETYTEYEARLLRAKQLEEKVKAKELNEYKRLKAKYDNI